jgi:transglutaminase-like putative cysteine protease
VPSETQNLSPSPIQVPASGPRRIRHLSRVAGIVLVLLLVVACGSILPTDIPSLFPSATSAPTVSATLSPAPSCGPTSTPDATPATTTPEPSGEVTQAPDPSITATEGPSPTPTPVPTPNPTATRAPTATPSPTATTTLFSGPYPVLFRDDYGTNQELYPSGDGTAVLDLGKTGRGLALAKVSTVYATDPTIRIKVLVYKAVGGVFNSGADYQYTILKRGEFVGIPLQLGSGTYKICILIRRNPTTNSYGYLLTKEFDVTLESALSPFLVSSALSDFSRASSCVAKAKVLCSGISTATGKVDAIYRFIIANISYDTTLANNINNGTVTVYVPDPDRTLASKKGICFDYSCLFSSMLRSQGIPARLVIGDFIKTRSDGSTYNVRHAWNEVYFEGKGWVVVNGFQWKYIDGKGWVLLDTTFGHSVTSQQIAKNIAGGMYVTFEYY